MIAYQEDINNNITVEVSAIRRINVPWVTGLKESIREKVRVAINDKIRDKVICKSWNWTKA